MRSKDFTIQEFRLTGRNESMEVAGFPAFKRGMMTASRQISGSYLLGMTD